MTHTSLPYNRALDPSDYQHPELSGHVAELRAWENRVRASGAPYRKDHEHREWEYANVLRQIHELLGYRARGEVRILDTGFGANYFTPMLASLGYAIEASDSMAYGDCTPWLIEQCHKLNLRVPVHVAPVEDLSHLADESFDVTLCISTIEHVEAVFWDKAWDELRRVTKVGGYLMVTTDYFPHLDAWNASKFKTIQHTPVTPDLLSEHLALNPTLVEIGGLDLTYRGDFVNNYSFVNVCLQRRT